MVCCSGCFCQQRADTMALVPNRNCDSLKIGVVKVKPTAKCLVVPATPTPQHWIQLTNLDRLVNPTYSSAILFYTKLLARSNRTFEEIVTSLKETLAMVLVDFYPLAGRLALRDENGLVDLLCNDAGAVFVEAQVDGDLAELGGGAPRRPMPALSGLQVARLGPGPLYVPDQLRSMPALVVQVTEFRKCGSVAVVVNWHHTVADGSSGCHFMKSWAEVATGKEISVKPNHNRGLLSPRATLDPSLVNEYSYKNVLFAQGEVAASLITSSQPTLLKSFSLPKLAATAIKAQAKTTDCEFTSSESISGLLWRLMTRARMQETNPNIDNGSTSHIDETNAASTTTRFFMFVDGRKKLSLPAGYFGNVVCSACASSDELSIVKNPISYAANLIRKATRDIDGEYFRSLIDWVEQQGHATSKSEHATSKSEHATSRSEHANSIGHDVAATFWTYFFLYETDFGWGKPDFAARNSGPRALIDGIAMMPSPEGSGDMVALLNLSADRMAKLETDPEFSAIFPHRSFSS